MVAAFDRLMTRGGFSLERGETLARKLSDEEPQLATA